MSFKNWHLHLTVVGSFQSKHFTFILLTCIVSLLSSCSTLYMANSCIDPIVFTKPVYKDSATLQSYLGGKFNKTDYINSYDKLVNNYFGQLYVHQTYTAKYFNTSYGVYGYTGKMHIRDYETPIYTKQFYGGGFSADIQLTIPFYKFIVKPIGYKGSFLYETGDYYKMRYNNLRGSALIPDKFMGNISQTIGASYLINNTSNLGVDFSLGYSSTIPHLYMDFTYSAIVNYTFRNISVYLQKSGGLMVSNDDLAIGLNFLLP